MDRIDVQDYMSRYCESPYPMIFINNRSLDLILCEYFNDEYLYGLVPSVTWLWDEEEQKLAIERFVNEISDSTFVPLLICPDDADFSCTVIIVEVEFSDDYVVWKRFGLDISDPILGICTTVKWLEPSLNFKFDKIKYREFKNSLLKILQAI
ncbi:MAG: hypothetical protein AAGE96_15825 [Cyanobacteria bacterium P01_G01_bin.19]